MVALNFQHFHQWLLHDLIKMQNMHQFIVLFDVLSRKHFMAFDKSMPGISYLEFM